MGLLIRIIELFSLFVIKLVKSSLTDDPDGNSIVIFIVNALVILAWLVGLGMALALLILAVSLKILLYALLLAYLAAFGWSKFCRYLSAGGQETYLLCSTVGLTVLIGTTIQLHKMPSADAHTLLVYWIFLLVMGFILWGITLFNVSTPTAVDPVFSPGRIQYTQRFRTTNISPEIPTINSAQAYLKNMK